MVRKFPPFRSERKKRSTSEGTPQFPNGISGKLPNHLSSNRNFRIFWSNGKHPCFRLSTSALLAALGIAARTSRHLTLTVTFARLLVLRYSHEFLRKRETLLQSRYMDYRPRRISINSQKRKENRGQYLAIFTNLHMATAPAV